MYIVQVIARIREVIDQRVSKGAILLISIIEKINHNSFSTRPNTHKCSFPIFYKFYFTSETEFILTLKSPSNSRFVNFMIDFFLNCSSFETSSPLSSINLLLKIWNHAKDNNVLSYQTIESYFYQFHKLMKFPVEASRRNLFSPTTS